MADQGGDRPTYNEYLFNRSYLQQPRASEHIDMGELPAYAEGAIGFVTSDDLLNLRQDDGLLDDIEVAMQPLQFTGSSILTWFLYIFRAPPGNDLGMNIPVNRLVQYPIELPLEIAGEINLALSEPSWQHLIELRRAQAFLRALFNQIQRSHPDLVIRIIYRLVEYESRRSESAYPLWPLLNLPPCPSARALPSPTSSSIAAAPVRQQRQTPTGNLQQTPARSTRTASAPSPTKEERRYYCPECGSKQQVGHLNDMRAHWFEAHARSNRSLAEMERKWNGGEMGPWTEEEAAGRKAVQTEEQKKKSKEMKAEAGRWREKRATDPDAFEREAQEKDGYLSFDKSFVSDKHKRLREKREEKGDKKRKRGEEE